MPTFQESDFHPEIETAIQDLAQCYIENKALILTELDLHCHLFAQLNKIPSLAGNHPTADEGITGPRVHSAMSWYNNNEKLGIVPDISIIETTGLSIIHPQNGVQLQKLIQAMERLPSKQFSFNGNAIIFEIKFCRGKMGITDKFFRDEIKKDFDKIEQLFQRLDVEHFPKRLFCYFVIFSKVDKKGALFQAFLKEHSDQNQSFRIIYKSGEVTMPDHSRSRHRST